MSYVLIHVIQRDVGDAADDFLNFLLVPTPSFTSAHKAFLETMPCVVLDNETVDLDVGTAPMTAQEVQIAKQLDSMDVPGSTCYNGWDSFPCLKDGETIVGVYRITFR